jgi:hypothetical protein
MTTTTGPAADPAVITVDEASKGATSGTGPPRLAAISLCRCPALRADGDLCPACRAELALLAAALDDAAGFRDLRSSARCDACASDGGGRCAGHQADEDRAALYRDLLASRYSAYLPAA